MPTREESRGNRKKSQQRQRFITVLVVMAGALVVAGLFIYPYLKPPVKTNPRPQANGTSMGDPNAPVKVVEFSDFQCPYCRQFSEKLEPQIITDFVKPGKTFFTYQPYSFIGTESVKSAEAAYCAADQNKFWEYHDLLFANQAGENVGNLTSGRLDSFAFDLRLDMSQFRSCVNTSKYSQKVVDDLAFGKSKGVEGTPYFLVDDKLVDSNQLGSAIQAALAAKGQ